VVAILCSRIYLAVHGFIHLEIRIIAFKIAVSIYSGRIIQVKSGENYGEFEINKDLSALMCRR
jgi:hypothetical protein